MHPFGPDPARRRPSAATPRRAPLRCAIGPAGRILGRVASCACAQTLFPAEPSAGTARTPPAGDVPPRRAASTPCTLLRPPQHPAFHSSGLRIPLSCPTAKSQLKPTPGVLDLANSGEPGTSAAAGTPTPASRSAARTSKSPVHPIRNRRPRLDRRLIESEPLDLNPTIEIQT